MTRPLSRPRALFSVRPFDGMADIARTLTGKNWEIVATDEACKTIRDSGIECRDAADFVGMRERFPFPPTLHPKMEQALTTDGGERIDLVFDIPYGPEVGNDVGGHTLLALAAKGGRLPVMSVSEMEAVARELSEEGGVSDQRRRMLIDKANHRIAAHFLALASRDEEGRFSGTLWEKGAELANGENPYQEPAFLCATGSGSDPLGLPRFERISGEPPCFTNLADLDSVLETLCRLHGALKKLEKGRRYMAVAAKHGNACGIGVSRKSGAEALEDALWGHPRAVWGGELIVNFPLDAALGEVCFKSERRDKALGNKHWMLHVIAAPGIDREAVRLLGKNSMRKLFVAPALSSPTVLSGSQVRPVRSGILLQPRADYVLNLDETGCSSRDALKDRTTDLSIAWAAAYTTNMGGNEVALAKNGALIGVGGGPATVDAAAAAVGRARAVGHDLKGAVFAADAFFPFIDAPEVLCRAGVAAGVAPGGGKYHDKVRAFFASKKVAMGFIPERFRGFCRH